MEDRPSRESLREVKREYKERRRAEKAREQYAADYWSATTGLPQRRRRRSAGRTTAIVAGLAVAAIAVGGAVLHVGPFAGTASSTAAMPFPTPSATRTDPAPATAGATSPAPSSPDATASSPSRVASGVDPSIHAGFATTPAVTWKVGAAGIVSPKARQQGIFNPSQVKDAYTQVVSYLREAVLDPRVLYEGALDPVLATFDAEQQRWLRKMVAAAKDSPADGIEWDAVANRFHVGDWRAAPEIRVKSSIRATANQDVLQVMFVVVAAYWLVHGDDAAQVVTIRREGYMAFYGHSPRHSGPAYYGGSSYTSSSSVCGALWPYRQFLEVWIDPSKVSGLSAAPVTSTWDPTDLNAKPTAPGCFHDTSGFR